MTVEARVSNRRYGETGVKRPAGEYSAVKLTSAAGIVKRRTGSVTPSDHWRNVEPP